MAKAIVKAGTTSFIVNIFIQDTSKTDGSGLTGVTYSSSGLVCYYKRTDGTASVSCTIGDITTLGTFAGTSTDAALKAVDGTNMPGVYELHIPNNALASGATSVVLMLKGVTNMAPVVLEIELIAVDLNDSVRMGLTALPNVAAGASGGLPLSTNASGHVTAATVSDKTGYTASTVTDKTGYSVSTVSDKTGYSVSAVSDKTGYSLSAAGLDAIVPETGYNVRQTLALILAAVAGVASGVDTGSPVFKAPDGTTTRISGTASDGNRSAITLSPPS